MVKVKGQYYESRKVVFPHRAVKAHGEHVVQREPGGPFPDDQVLVVRCDGTMVGAQG